MQLLRCLKFKNKGAFGAVLRKIIKEEKSKPGSFAGHRFNINALVPSPFPEDRGLLAPLIVHAVMAEQRVGAEALALLLECKADPTSRTSDGLSIVDFQACALAIRVSLLLCSSWKPSERSTSRASKSASPQALISTGHASASRRSQVRCLINSAGRARQSKY